MVLVILILLVDQEQQIKVMLEVLQFMLDQIMVLVEVVAQVLLVQMVLTLLEEMVVQVLPLQ